MARKQKPPSAQASTGYESKLNPTPYLPQEYAEPPIRQHRIDIRCKLERLRFFWSILKERSFLGFSY